MKKSKSIEEKTIEQVAKYLNYKGWSYVVGGFESIEQGNRKYNFRLIFGFVGKKK